MKPEARLEICAVDAPSRAPQFAQDVRDGLTCAPYRLPSKYFYDELGSAIFDAITLLPEYYLTRAETEILRENACEIVRALGSPVEFLELGGGSAVKTRLLIEEALRAQRALHYVTIDISEETLRRGALALIADYPDLTIAGYAADYFSVLGTPLLARPGRVLEMFMGSNLGNYAPAQSAALLQAIAASLKPGDGLLLGLDLRKDPAVLIRAYNDTLGLTAAFNKNLLSRINRELGGEFDLHDFEFVAEYDEAHGVVESYLCATRGVSVRIAGAGHTVTFRPGERIHTESSFKFSHEQVRDLAVGAGLRLERVWRDREERFAVNLLVRT